MCVFRRAQLGEGMIVESETSGTEPHLQHRVAMRPWTTYLKLLHLFPQLEDRVTTTLRWLFWESSKMMYVQDSHYMEHGSWVLREQETQYYCCYYGYYLHHQTRPGQMGYNHSSVPITQMTWASHPTIHDFHLLIHIMMPNPGEEEGLDCRGHGPSMGTPQNIAWGAWNRGMKRLRLDCFPQNTISPTH